MKQKIALSLALALMAGNVFGQAQIIKQRAKGLANNLNAQQGVPPPSAPGAPAAPGAAPAVSATPGISTAQQVTLDHLTADLATIKTGVAVTAGQKETIQKDLMQLVKGAAKPTQASMTKLTTDLAAALADNNVNDSDKSQISRLLNVLLNSSNLSYAQLQDHLIQTSTALKAAGVTTEASLQVVNDLKAIYTDYYKSKPKLFQ